MDQRSSQGQPSAKATHRDREQAEAVLRVNSETLPRWRKLAEQFVTPFPFRKHKTKQNKAM